MPKTTRVHSRRSRTRPYAGRPQQSRRRGSRGRHRGLDPADIENLHFHFADPDACLLGTARPNGPIVPTPLFEALRASALKIRPTLSRWTASRHLWWESERPRSCPVIRRHVSHAGARGRLCCCWITRAHRA
jgi:hypothetical protein